MFKPKHPLHLSNVLFLTISPLLALIGATYHLHRFGHLNVVETVLFVFMVYATGMSITGGYHRYFSHAAYKANPLVKLFYLIFGACALQNSAINWASDHRIHHRYTDTDQDPYNAGQGFFWSHIGWIFYQSRQPKQLTNVPDLLSDPLVRWQDKYYLSIAMVFGFVIPTLIGAAFGCALGAFIWAGLVRVVLVHHATFFINSLAHMWGKQPYSRDDSSRDSWWLPFLTNGEGYHNFHHKFPSDYRNGVMWYQWDPTKWLIWGLSRLGMTTDLHRMPAHIIEKARLDMQALDAESELAHASSDVRLAFRERLHSARLRMDQAMTQLAETKARYQEIRKAKKVADQPAHTDWREKLKGYEERLAEAREQWRAALQSNDRELSL